MLYQHRYLRRDKAYAELAHLVERNLAKVEVASSSLVVRSKFFDNELETGWTRSSVG